MTFVKFCGMTREADVEAAAALGVSAVGFVLWPGSPRFVSPEQLPLLVSRVPREMNSVAVFVQPSSDDIARALDAGVGIVQIHGAANRPAVDVTTWMATTVDADMTALGDDVTVLLDASDPARYGGTGRTIDWTRATPIAAARRVVLAGGLTPVNVADAIRQVRPYGVDVASGIEERPGVKQAAAMRAFVAAVRGADRG